MSGFAPFGNFWNYYQFNKVEERMQFINIELVIENIINQNNKKDFSVLDIGCNEGDISIAIYNLIQEKSDILFDHIHFLALDVDNELITRAKHKNTKINFNQANIMQSTLPIDFIQSKNIERYDIVFVLSITMWIHLNHGDEGLNVFLDKLCLLSNNIIIEPHPWKCYLTMRKRNKKNSVPLPYSLDTLKIRNNVVNYIEDRILKNGFILKETLGVTKWGRKIVWFSRNI